MEAWKRSERRGDGAWRSFSVSGGSGGHFAGLMAALHPLPRWEGIVKTSQNQSKLLNLKFGEFYEHIFHRVNKVGYSSTFMNIHFIELIK